MPLSHSHLVSDWFALQRFSSWRDRHDGAYFVTLLNGGSRHFVTVSKTLSKILRQLVASQSNAICACVSCLLSDYVNHVHIAHCLQLIDCDTGSGAIKLSKKATVE